MVFNKRSVGQGKSSVSDLLLISLLAGTDGPAELSAGGLSARGEESLSSSGTSGVTTSTVSTVWFCISDGKINTKKTTLSFNKTQTKTKLNMGKIHV